MTNKNSLAFYAVYNTKRKGKSNINEEKKYGFNNESRKRAMNYSTQKPTQRNFDSIKAVGGGSVA